MEVAQADTRKELVQKTNKAFEDVCYRVCETRPPGVNNLLVQLIKTGKNADLDQLRTAAINMTSRKECGVITHENVQAFSRELKVFYEQVTQIEADPSSLDIDALSVRAALFLNAGLNNPDLQQRVASSALAAIRNRPLAEPNDDFETFVDGNLDRWIDAGSIEEFLKHKPEVSEDELVALLCRIRPYRFFTGEGVYEIEERLVHKQRMTAETFARCVAKALAQFPEMSLKCATKGWFLSRWEERPGAWQCFYMARFAAVANDDGALAQRIGSQLEDSEKKLFDYYVENLLNYPKVIKALGLGEYPRPYYRLDSDWQAYRIIEDQVSKLPQDLSSETLKLVVRSCEFAALLQHADRFASVADSVTQELKRQIDSEPSDALKFSLLRLKDDGIQSLAQTLAKDDAVWTKINSIASSYMHSSNNEEKKHFVELRRAFIKGRAEAQ